jgi:hypothetical protein
MVSIPSDSGITSSSNQSSPGARLPASRLACTAAPSATTLSGSILASGVVWKYSLTALAHVRHAGRAADQHHAIDIVRVRLASRSAFLDGVMVLATRCW